MGSAGTTAFLSLLAGAVVGTGIAYTRYRGQVMDQWSEVVSQEEEPAQEVDRFGHMVTKYRLWARAEYGVPRDTPANRIIVSEGIRRKMKADNVRDCDISRYFSAAVEMTFVPTRSDIRARRMGAGRTARSLKASYANPIPTFIQWLTGWTGVEAVC